MCAGPDRTPDQALEALARRAPLMPAEEHRCLRLWLACQPPPPPLKVLRPSLCPSSRQAPGELLPAFMLALYSSDLICSRNSKAFSSSSDCEFLKAPLAQRIPALMA